MRVLHLFSNHKWTGPAEPALNLCAGLKSIGVEVDFACSPGPDLALNKVLSEARERGIDPLLNLHLSKHRHLFWDALDRRVLGKILAARAYDLVHCHLENDHEIAIAPAARAGVPLLRSSYHGEGFPANRRNKRLIGHCAMLIEPSEIAKTNDLARFGVNGNKIEVVPGAVDTTRFDPARNLPDMRVKFNIPPEKFVLGIVARMQTHRHYEDLFRAFKLLLADAPDAHLVVVGRGTRQEHVGFGPVRDLGIADSVTFTGFVDGDEYTGTLQLFDAGVYLVPGSDGTCRTVREMMAMGKPVIVARRGMLPEIVMHAVDGLVFDNSVQGLHEAFMRLYANLDDRKRMGEAAREKAVTRYSIPAQAQAVAEIYRKIR